MEEKSLIVGPDPEQKVTIKIVPGTLVGQPSRVDFAIEGVDPITALLMLSAVNNAILSQLQQSQEQANAAARAEAAMRERRNALPGVMDIRRKLN
jgi:hypothetical protein